MDKLIEKIARYTHTAKPATRRSFLKLVGKATIAAGTAAGIAAVSLQTASAYDGGDGGIALEETTDTCCNMTKYFACFDKCKSKLCKDGCVQENCWICT